MSVPPALGVVAIGRNEGARLDACLGALVPLGLPIVYVDSGSSDGSPDRARSAGAEVVELDPSRPLSAARARREGCLQLTASHPELEYVFFVDGDCQTDPAWPAQAIAFLAAHPQVAAVCGRRRERDPHASRYNLLCDLEWNAPPGPCDAMGGDAVYRLTAYHAAGGFDPTVPAGEEPELCHRLRAQGWQLERLDAEMTLHDAAMTRWAQWVRRQYRSGYGGWDVERRFGIGIFRSILRSSYFWGIAYPLGALAIALLTGFFFDWRVAGLLLALAAAGLLVQILRITRSLVARGYPRCQARHLAYLLMAGKLPTALGALRARWDEMTGRQARLIEYKQSGQKPCAQR
jgi:glycosyltransferase involved in cell wall biosynthesis